MVSTLLRIGSVALTAYVTSVLVLAAYCTYLMRRHDDGANWTDP